MPADGAGEARRFYVHVLGMAEIAKPHGLEATGSIWFASGGVELHLGIDPNFKPATKAHPAFRCRDYDTLIDRLRKAEVEVKTDGRIPGVRRCHISDPFGNRIELIAE
ncbi:MAG TPA: VOC family protein [Terriglobales bacterium]|nr:VOC family protein [Terriglobales bacterium]